MKSCIDLSLLARSVDSRWKGKYTNPIGLANLVATYEFLALGKGKITRSNWEAQLSFKQQECECYTQVRRCAVTNVFHGLDAANDGHSGYTIYSRLIKMAGTMGNPPGETCYSFGVNRGSLCDPFGRAWHPINPDYDPGPPPPPKPPKEKKEGETEKPRASVSKQPQQPRGHYYHHQHDEGLDHVPHRLGEAVPGSSSGQTNGRRRPIGDRTEVSGGRGRGYVGPGPIRQPRGRGRGRIGGSGVGTLNKYVRVLLRKLR